MARDGTSIHEVVLESMHDGVIALDGDGQIRQINDAGVQILGVRADEVVGRSFAEALIEIEGLDEFTQSILDCVLDPESTGQRDVGIDTEGGPRVLTVVTTLLRDDPPYTGVKRGVVAVFRDVTAVVRLHASEAKLNEEVREQYKALQDAYREVEERDARLAAARRGARMVRWIGGVAFVVVAAALGVAVLGPELETSPQAPAGAATVQATRDVTVTARPLRTTMRIRGTLSPGHTHPVVAGVKGTVKEMGFTWGQRVERGQLLVRVDPETVEREHRAKLAEVIRSRRELARLEAWEASGEMIDARTNLALAERAAVTASAQLDEVAYLLGKGVVARREHAQAEQALADAERSVESARRSLAATRAKGDAEALRVARLEHENREGELAKLERQLESTEVRALAAGVASRPVRRVGEDAPAEMAVGVEVERGAVLLSLVDGATLAVEGQVGEHEIVALEPGQAVTVRGDAFPGLTLGGRVVHVGSRPGGAGGTRAGQARFPVRALLDALAPEVRARLRLGMSADVSIVVREVEAALMVPIAAVGRSAGRQVVMRRDTAGAEPQEVEVRTGETRGGEVEVLEGVAEGDIVVVGAVRRPGT